MTSELMIRLGFALSNDDRDPNSHNARYGLAAYQTEWETIRDQSFAEFDAWLAEHDRLVAERVWEEGALAAQEHTYRENPYETFPDNPYREEGTK